MIKILRKKRKTLSINIDVFGNVIVKAPLFVKDSEIEHFINLKKPWISKILSKINSTNTKYCEIFNKSKGLIFGKIVDYNEDFVNNLKKIAEEYLPLRIDELARRFNLKFSSIKLKNYKSRWGSCDRNKNISLNYKLIMIDKDLIDYVIIHELCHTVYFNHKKQFHQLLKSFFYNESALRKRLNEFSFINKIDY
ncbi:MAG: M48 family metallopeptidase [Clostridiales bacterium]|nr:M48 family metallopeptidase [Clostridiales bacterium]